MARASAKKTTTPAIQDVEESVAAISTMTVKELQTLWEELYGAPTNTRNRPYLQKRLAFRTQELAEGGLSERAKEKSTELRGKVPGPRKAKPDSESKASAPVTRASTRDRDPRLPRAGTMILREYKGKSYKVTVHDTDFEYGGKRFGSLSTIAREITGQIWNGFLFFGLVSRPAKKGAA